MGDLAVEATLSSDVILMRSNTLRRILIVAAVVDAAVGAVSLYMVMPMLSPLSGAPRALTASEAYLLYLSGGILQWLLCLKVKNVLETPPEQQHPILGGMWLLCFIITHAGYPTIPLVIMITWSHWPRDRRKG